MTVLASSAPRLFSIPSMMVNSIYSLIGRIRKSTIDIQRHSVLFPGRYLTCTAGRIYEMRSIGTTVVNMRSAVSMSLVLDRAADMQERKDVYLMHGSFSPTIGDQRGERGSNRHWVYPAQFNYHQERHRQGPSAMTRRFTT